MDVKLTDLQTMPYDMAKLLGLVAVHVTRISKVHSSNPDRRKAIMTEDFRDFFFRFSRRMLGLLENG
jgi:hypothetical protein